MKNKLLLLLVLLISSNVLAQQLTIRGTITDSKTGDAVIGAHIRVVGTDNIQISDVYGGYTINVASDQASLSFSYVGYADQTIALSPGQTELNVVLVEEATAIDAVVAVGYGVTKKKLTTGANLNVKGSDVAKLNTASAMEALAGVAPGLSVQKNNGAPGSGTKVNIRGIGTVGSSSPLYIVDGVATGSIDNINPQSIESIDVLKDAASAAIYGSRAANGVILVTTKKGRSNQKTQVSYSGYYGVQNIASAPTSLNASQYMFIQDEMRTNDGLAPVDWRSNLQNNAWLNSVSPGLGVEYGDYIWGMLENGWEGTNWLDELVYENAPVTSHNINITGGGTKTTYAMGVGYYDQTGLVGGDIIGAGYKRFDLSFNSDMILFADEDGRAIVTVGENLTYSNTTNKSVATGNIYYSDIYNALRTSPLMPVYWDQAPDDTGIAPNLDGLNFAHSNPMALMYYSRSQFSDGRGNNILGNAYINIEPIKDLKIRSSFGVNASFGSSRNYTPTNKGFGAQFTPTTTDNVSQGMNQYAEYTWTNTINYKKSWGDHNFDFLVGNEVNKTMINMGVGGSKAGSLYNDLEHAYLNNVPKPESVSQIDTYGYDWAAQGGGLISYMGRVSYNYDDKYMADFTMRADGSSNFAPGKQWGYFPSAAAGWNFSEEDFMQEVNFLSYGKLRASWGQNGNQTLMDQWGNYVGFVYSSNITTTGNGYYFGDNKVTSSTTSYPSNVPNQDVTWETSEQLNLGVDLRFFRSRLGVTFDWYHKTTKDWLVIAPILGTSGAGAPFVNGGDIVNQGTELTVSWNDTAWEDFKYGATLSLYTNVNEVTKLASAGGFMNGPTSQMIENGPAISRIEVGMPIGFFYGYKTDGLLQNQADVDGWVNENGEAYFADAKPGDVKFVDVNGDGVINDEDRTMIGNPNPDVSLGLQLNFEYKGAFLNATLTGEFGHQVANSYFWAASGDNNLWRNWTTQIFDRWTGEGTSNKIPILSSGSHRNSQWFSESYIYDADYIRMTNLTVGYNFAEMFTEGIMSNLTLYVSASNLFTITDYEGFDPDVAYGGDGASWASGVDLGLYPLPRTFMIGLNLTF